MKEVKSLKKSILKMILSKINSNKKRPNLHIKK
jgi:mRNA-degrading endonuclease RelE of RelBE toxin-antitoxin system